jgi:transposase
MSIISQCLGIDVAAKDAQVCFMVKTDTGHYKIKGSRSFPNTVKGISSLEQWLKKRCHDGLFLSVVMEATGVYYENLAYTLYEADHSVHVLLPNRVKGYLKFLNLKSKTDKIEARALAQLGLDQQLPVWKPATPQMYALKRVCREKNMLTDEKTMISNRLHAEQSCKDPQKAIIKRLKQRLKLVDKQIDEVESQVRQMCARDEQLSQRIENITSIKGVGFMTAITLIAETNGFELITHKSQLVSYSGYDVVERQSGSSVKGKTRISKKGNSHIRRCLHFPALSVVKYNDEFKALFTRVLDRTKIKMKGYVAVQRKLLVLIYTLYKKNQPYDPKYAQRQAEEQNCRQDTMPAYTG